MSSATNENRRLLELQRDRYLDLLSTSDDTAGLHGEYRFHVIRIEKELAEMETTP